jgi:CxxC motif-containing protein
MMREFTCIICPNGCGISADIEIESGVSVIRSIDGALCPRGETYVRQELIDPRRNIATSVLVKGGILPLASVRLTKPIPKDRIFDAMEEIKKCSLTAPVTAGTVIVKNVLGYDANVIVTKSVPAGELLK